jgi:DNA polymerase elongation subunit (family B)
MEALLRKLAREFSYPVDDLAVIPCRSSDDGDIRPILKVSECRRDRSVCSGRTIRSVLESYPDVELFLLPLTHYPYIVIDVDYHGDENENGLDPQTLLESLFAVMGDNLEGIYTVSTYRGDRGGRHYYFRVSNDVMRAGKSSVLGDNTMLFRGVDLLITNCVVAPYSVRGGVCYTPQTDSFRLYETRDVPPWLLYLLSNGRFGWLTDDQRDALVQFVQAVSDEVAVGKPLSSFISGGNGTRYCNPCNDDLEVEPPASFDPDKHVYLYGQLKRDELIDVADWDDWREFFVWLTRQLYGDRSTSQVVLPLSPQPGEKFRVNVRCPFHDDRTPSMTVAANGKLLVRCHACAQYGVDQYVLYYSYLILRYYHRYLTGKLKLTQLFLAWYRIDSRGWLRVHGLPVYPSQLGLFAWSDILLGVVPQIQGLAAVMEQYRSSPLGRRIYGGNYPQFEDLAVRYWRYIRANGSSRKGLVNGSRANRLVDRGVSAVNMAGGGNGLGHVELGQGERVRPNTWTSVQLLEVHRRFIDCRRGDPHLLVGNLIHIGGFYVIVGSPGSGKSNLLRVLARQFLAGGRLFNRPVRKCRLLYINMDESSGHFVMRLRRLISQFGAETLADQLLIWDVVSEPSLEEIIDSHGGDILSVVEEIVNEFDPQVILLDGLNHLILEWGLSRGFNDAKISDNYMLMTKFAREIRSRLLSTKRTLIATMHARKESTRGMRWEDMIANPATSPIGSIAIAGGTDGVFYLVQEDVPNRIFKFVTVKHRHTDNITYRIQFDERMETIIHEERVYDPEMERLERYGSVSRSQSDNGAGTISSEEPVYDHRMARLEQRGSVSASLSSSSVRAMQGGNEGRGQPAATALDENEEDSVGCCLQHRAVGDVAGSGCYSPPPDARVNNPRARTERSSESSQEWEFDPVFDGDEEAYRAIMDEIFAELETEDSQQAADSNFNNENKGDGPEHNPRSLHRPDAATDPHHGSDPLGHRVSSSLQPPQSGTGPVFYAKPVQYLIDRTMNIESHQVYCLDMDASLSGDAVIVLDVPPNTSDDQRFYRSVRPVRKGEKVPRQISFYGYSLLHTLRNKRPFRDKAISDVRYIVFDMEASHIDPKRGRVLAICARTNDGQTVVFDHKSESALLMEFFAFVRNYNPTWLVGYNIFRFDIPYILERLKHYGVHFGWLDNFTKYHDTFRAGSNQFHVDLYRPKSWVYKSDFHERAIVDLYLLAHRYLPGLESYALPAVYEHLFKEPFGEALGDKAGMADWDMELVRRQVTRDVDRTERVMQSLLQIPFSLVQMVPATFHEVLYMGQASLWSRIMVMEYIRHGYPIVVTEYGDEAASDQDGTYRGAISDHRESGLFGPTGKIDVVSLYPNIIIKYLVHPRQDYLALLPQLVRGFLDMRVRLKSLAKQTGDPLLVAQQNALKVLINSAYGYMGTRGVMWFDESAAATVTEKGRETLMKMEEIIGLTQRVLEVDTDGVLFEILDEGRLDAILDALREETRFDYELDRYDASLVVSAKNYALLDGDKVVIKGASLMNRAQPQYIMKLMGELVRKILELRRDSSVVDYDSVLGFLEESASKIMDPSQVPDEMLIERVLATGKTANRRDVVLDGSDQIVGGDTCYVYYAEGREKRVLSKSLPSELGLTLDRVAYVRKFYDAFARLFKIKEFEQAFKRRFGSKEQFLSCIVGGQAKLFA